MLKGPFNALFQFCKGEAIGQSRRNRVKFGRITTMNLKKTLIVGSLAAVLGTGAAFAQQSYSENPPPSQAAPYQQHRHHHGVLALVREEVTAGRISRKEGMLLEQKIREMKREKREERQARMQGEYGRGAYGQGSYQQGGYPPSQQPPQQ
jgi:hypothetical protein